MYIEVRKKFINDLSIWLSMLSLACKDAGVTDCEYVAKGETEEELWKDGTEHVVKVHGFKREDVTEDFKAQHSSFIKRT